MPNKAKSRSTCNNPESCGLHDLKYLGNSRMWFHDRTIVVSAFGEKPISNYEWNSSLNHSRSFSMLATISASKRKEPQMLEQHVEQQDDWLAGYLDGYNDTEPENTECQQYMSGYRRGQLEAFRDYKISPTPKPRSIFDFTVFESSK